MKEIYFLFQLSKTKVFEVSIEPDIIYRYTGENNKMQDGFCFYTSSSELLKNKLDFKMVGQCQDVITFGYETARNFWKKWDKIHFQKINEEQFQAIINDLKVLKDTYNYIEQESPISFQKTVEFTKQKPKQGNYRKFV